MKDSSLGQQLCDERTWRQYKCCKDDRCSFVAPRSKLYVHVNFNLDYTRMPRLVSVLDTRAMPNFIGRSKLPNGFESQMSTGPRSDICNVNWNPQRMLGTTKMLVYLGNTRVALKLIISETLAAAAILGINFSDQHVRTIRSKRKLVELDSGDQSKYFPNHKVVIRNSLPCPTDSQIQRMIQGCTHSLGCWKRPYF